MGYLVCEKCGGYYKLKPGESPNKFSDNCECGGKLKYVENLKTTGKNLGIMKPTITCPKCGFQWESGAELTSNEISSDTLETKKPDKTPEHIPEDLDKQSKNKKIAIGVLSVFLIGTIILVLFGGLIFHNNTTSIGETNFQNQYVSFEYPTGYNAQPITNSDASNRIMDIGIYKNGKLVGELSYLENQQTDLVNMEKTAKKTTIAGKNAITASDSNNLYADVILGNTTSGLNKLITIDTDPSSSDLYNEITKTLVIKQTPPDVSS